MSDFLALNYYSNRIGNDIKVLLSSKSYSLLASTRIQLLPALRAAQNLGLKPASYSLSASQPGSLNHIGHPKVCLVGKMIGDNSDCAVANMSAVARLNRMGIPILVMYSNHHLSRDDKMGEFYRSIAYYASYFIYPTEKLKELSAQYLPKEKIGDVIVDPWQIPEFISYPKLDISANIQLLWYGTRSNLEYLDRELSNIKANLSLSDLPKITLTILTGKKHLSLFYEYLNLNKSMYPNFNYRFLAWDGSKNPAQFQNELRKAHIALIPSDSNDLLKVGASHNRLVDAIRAGCIPIASPIDSYIELNKVALVGNNFPKMLLYAINNYERLSKKYTDLREDILARFSPELNEKSWERVISRFG